VNIQQIRPTAPLMVLPSLHLILCIVVALMSSEGSWRWFPMFLIDFPLSIVLGQMGDLPPLITFGILGTLWWYFIGVMIRLAHRGWQQY
jgi:hypothetical protein